MNNNGPRPDKLVSVGVYLDVWNSLRRLAFNENRYIRDIVNEVFIRYLNDYPDHKAIQWKKEEIE